MCGANLYLGAWCRTSNGTGFTAASVVSAGLSSLGSISAVTVAVGLADCGTGTTGLALVVQGELFLQALALGGGQLVGSARRVPGIANATAVAAGFVDQGSQLDLVVCCANGTVVLVRDVCSDTARRLEVIWTMPSTCGGVALGTLDADGSPDVVLTPLSPGHQGTVVLLNNGYGSFTRALPAYSMPSGPAPPVIVDVNGNGVPDVPGVGLMDPFPTPSGA